MSTDHYGSSRGGLAPAFRKLYHGPAGAARRSSVIGPSQLARACPISKQTSHAANAIFRAAVGRPAAGRRQAAVRPNAGEPSFASGDSAYDGRQTQKREGIEMNSALLIGLVWFLVFAAAPGTAAVLGHNLNAWYIGWLVIDAMSALLVAGSFRLGKT
jgi:hypothetical protein